MDILSGRGDAFLGGGGERERLKDVRVYVGGWRSEVKY